MNRCATCVTEQANHTIETTWGQLYLCQRCAEIRAAGIARELGLEKQGPRPEEHEDVDDSVWFTVFHRCHGIERVEVYTSLTHAYAGYTMQAEWALRCSYRDHHSEIMVTQGDVTISLLSTDY